jgi:hypothetical protein
MRLPWGPTAGQTHLGLSEHFHRLVILRSVATKDLRLSFGQFPAHRRRFDIAEAEKNNRRSFPFARPRVRMTSVGREETSNAFALRTHRLKERDESRFR